MPKPVRLTFCAVNELALTPELLVGRPMLVPQHCNVRSFLLEPAECVEERSVSRVIEERALGMLQR